MFSNIVKFVRDCRFLVVSVMTILLFVSDSMAQYSAKTCEIVGKVRCINTYEALIGVNVYLEGTNYGSATDNNGEYRIHQVPPGSYRLVATYMGYKKYTKDITIVADEVLNVDIDMTISPFLTDEIVVTATRTPKTIKNVPVRTEIITTQEIQKQEAKTIYEALAAQPGVRVEQQCSNCNFSMLRMEGLEGGYSQVLIDGQSSFTGLAGVYGLQQLQTGNVQQIEIVKGAGSALYGSDAIGGVVNVITKEPTALPEYSFGVNIGEYGSQHIFINGSQRLHRLGVVFSAQRDIEGAIDQTGGGESSQFDDTGEDNFTDRVESENQGADIKIYVYNPFGEKSTLNFFGRARDEFRRGGNLSTWDDPYDPDSEHISTTRYETGFEFSKTTSTDVTFHVDYTYVNHYRNATNGAAWDKAISGGMVDDDLNFTSGGSAYIEEHGFAQFREEWYPKPFIVEEKIHLVDSRISRELIAAGMDLHLLGGIQYRRSDLDQDINGVESDKYANDTGLYGQADMHISENLEAVAGMRFDMHDSKDYLTNAEYDTKVFNPRLALRYSMSEDLTLRGSLGQGYRVPYLFAEDMHLCASAPRIYKGPDLDPEKATSLSVGADLYKVQYSLGVSLFYTKINDKIDFIDDGSEIPSGYDYRWMNFGDASTKGFDISTSALLLNNNVNLKGDISYVIAKYSDKRFTAVDYPTAETNDGWKDSDYIPRSPKLTGNISATIELPNNFQVYAHTKYTGSMFIDHVPGEEGENLIIEKTDGFFLVNAKLMKTFFNRFNVFIGGKNIFDYVQPTRDNSDAAYIYGPIYGRILYSGFDIIMN